MPESQVSMSNFTGREIIHGDLKREAAQKALAYIHEGDVVALNSGTTNTVVAQELLSLGKKCTVVTNNFAAASVLLQAPHLELVLVGGQMDPQERSTYGSLCEQEFAKFYPDVALLSINAVNYKDGYDTGVTPQPGDQLLTLSTCSYHTGEGRFVVVCRRNP